MAEQHFLEPFYRIQTESGIYYLSAETEEDMRDAVACYFSGQISSAARGDLKKTQISKELVLGSYNAFLMYEQGHITNLTPDFLHKRKLSASLYQEKELKYLQHLILRKRLPETPARKIKGKIFPKTCLL